MPDAQDVDSLFPAKPPGTPGGPQDVDSLFPANVQASRHARNYGEATGDSVQDLLFGDTSRSSVARVLDAFGEGFAQGWGGDQVGLSDQTAQKLRDVGLFNDYTKGQYGIVKAGNEALIRPAATALDTLWRAGAGVFRGGQAAIAQTGAEAGYPLLGRELAAIPEAFPAGTAAVIGETPSLLATARDMKVIGSGEAGWRGTQAAREETKFAPIPEKPAVQPTGTQAEPQVEPGAPVPSAPATASIAPQPNIHAVVRQDNPDLFSRYDPLVEQQVQLRMWIDEGIDTDVARDKLKTVDGELAALAPQVQQAYRDAAEKANTPTVLAQPSSLAQAIAERPTGIAPAAAPSLAGEAAAPSIEQQRAFIQNDVARQMIAAGRPEAEAQAAGAIIAARYEARAARFNGALGTAQELYQREGAEIRGPGGMRPPPAGGVGPAPPIAPAPSGIDATHDVVTGANSAKDPNGPTYIDRHIPQYSPTLKDDHGIPVNLWNFLDLHERTEADAMAAGATYEEAHAEATQAERELARRTGIDFDAETKEMDGYLAHVEKENPQNPPAEELHVAPEVAMDKHTSAKKQKVEGYGPLVPEYQKWSMLDNADEYKTKARERREKYGAGGGQVFKTALARDRAQGITSDEVKTARTRFDQGVSEAGIGADEYPAAVRDLAVEAMVDRGMDPLDALDYATAKFEHDANWQEDDDARLAAEGVIDTEEGHGDIFGAIPFEAGGHAAPLGEEGARAGPQGNVPVGEPAREAGAARPEEVEYFQRRRGASRDLIAEREREGQQELPVFDRISQAELVQRRANEPLRPAVEQKPMDEGLFSDEAKQKELFQGASGRVRLAPDRKPIITLAKTADASTFMHESGHVFLEELMRDAEHPQAPDLLRADWGTTRKWLGMEEGEDIATRHHEKFARGFEQYLREGVAPSPGLARVFAQFRDWLLRVYQTIRGLGQPINEDIRGVFDRLLAEKPERTVIAPELAKRPTLADIHESDAVLAEPEAAEKVGDQVTEEAHRYAAALPQDIADEHGRIAAETGAVGRAGEPLPEAGGTSEPVAPRGAGGPQSGAEPSGGGEPLPQGTGARTGEAAAVGPQAPLPRPEGHFLDKAGNIRLDNLGTPEDVNAVIREAADANADFLPERRGVVSDQQVLNLADALGMSPEQLNTRRIGQAYNAEQIVAARKLLIQSAQAVRDAAAKAADGSDAEVLAYAQAADRHRMIQGQVSGITAEAGRALRAFRALAGAEEAKTTGAIVQEATGRTLFQLRATAKKIANLDTAQQVSKLVRDSEKKGFFDWLQAYFINALISGPFTHGGYTAAGEIYGLFRAVGETSASALVGKIRQAIGYGPAEYAHIAEMPHQLYGMLRGARDGIKNAYAAIKSNQVVLPPEVERQLEMGDVTGQTISSREVIPNPVIAGYKIPIGTTIEAPGRLVAALHSFNWTTFYSQSIAGQAFRQAMAERLQGNAFAQRIADLTANPSEAMIKEAGHDANAGALMQRPEYDSLMGGVSRLTNFGVKVPDLPLPGGKSLPMGTLRPLKYIDPFVQIQANIQRAAFMRGTPLSLFNEATRADLSMKNGGVAFDRTAGRILAGSGFMLAAGGLAAEHLLNGSGPSDPKESREWQRVFGLPHGLRIGEMSYDVLRLGNIGLQMSVAADLWHAVESMRNDDISKVTSDLVYAFAQNIVDESSMRGPMEILQAIDDHDRYGARWVQNFASSFTPFSVGMSQIARQIDPYSRVARTTMDAIKAKIPFVSETLTPRLDVWGQPVPNRGWLGTYRQAVENDPVDKALYDLHIYPAQPSPRIRGVKLSDRQYYDYAGIAGRDAKMRLNALVSMPGFAQMPVAPKIELINKAISGARDRARNLVLMKYPEIIEQAVANKRAKLNPTVH